jgi:hypothetical protein
MTLILNGDTGLSDVDGSAATPAIRGTDSNTGIFFPAADTIAFAEGGAEVARFDSSGNLGIGTSTPAVKLDVAGAISATGAIQASGVATNIYPLVAGTSQASTSGTSIDFTGIPSWVRRITVMFNSVSVSGSSSLLIQIGSGSVLTSGYGSSAAFTGTSAGGGTSTAGFLVTTTTNSSNTLSGISTICLVGSNTYVSTGNMIYESVSPISFVMSSAGVRTSIGGALDRVRITTVNGTDTFDAGSINILYE